MTVFRRTCPCVKIKVQAVENHTVMKFLIQDCDLPVFCNADKESNLGVIHLCLESPRIAVKCSLIDW